VIGTAIVVENSIMPSQNQVSHWFNQNAEKNIEIFESKLSKAHSLMDVASNLPEMKSIHHDISHDSIGIAESEETAKRIILKNIIDASRLYSEMGYFLPDGELYLLEPYPEQSKFQFRNFAFRDWYRGALNTDGIYTSEVFEAQPDFRKTIAFSKKITDENNQLVGILVGVIDFEKIKEIIGNDNTLGYYFIDHNHNLIFGSGSSSEQSFKHHAFTSEIELALSGKDGISQHKLDDVSVNVFYKPVIVDGHTWAFLSVISEDDFDNPALIRIALYGILAMFASSMLFMIYKKSYRDYFGFKKTISEISSLYNIEDTSTIKISKPHNSSIFFMIATIALAGFLVYDLVLDSTRNNEEMPQMTSGHVIQNLRGDIIDTWIAWNISYEDDRFHIHLQDSPEVNEKVIQATLDVIMSTQGMLIDDSELHKGLKGTSSKYYVGWYGALNSIDKDTVLKIPKNLHFDVTEKGNGDIIINLKDYASSDGYSGFTNSIVDESNHQILKSSITIYDADSLSIEQYKTILRHELGHGFGLAHSTAPEDLMHSIITTEYPYISECDLDAITALYDGSQKSQVVCEK
jgi:hypothetical protein